jgi:hypothetical protein
MPVPCWNVPGDAKPVFDGMFVPGVNCASAATANAVASTIIRTQKIIDMPVILIRYTSGEHQSFSV